MYGVINLAVIVDGEYVLIVNRQKPEKTKTGKILTWAFPGGHQEYGEKPEKAVVRETLEETGYKIKVIKLINYKIHPETGVVVRYFLCELEEKEPVALPQENYEIKEIRWIKIEELPNYFTTPLDSEVEKTLKKFIKK
jgi:8-oxo-dGTP diphosphatase